MLQWMGGSRRKVTTSRKSTQQRQKQYFEQRRRQQQRQGQTTGFESYADGLNISEQHHKEHRSLDILSLLNLSTTAQENKSSYPNRREDLEVNALRPKCDITTDSPKLPSKMVAPLTSVEVNKAKEPSYFKHQKSEKCHDFMVPNGARHHAVGRNFDFGGVTWQPDWSCLMNENERDNLSLLSEESCSSSAVRDNAIDSSLSKPTWNWSKRRHDNAYADPVYHLNITSTGKTQIKSRHVVQPEDIAHGSGKCTKMPDSSKFEPFHHSNSPLQEKFTPSSNWFPEEGYLSVDNNSGCTSFHQKSESNCPSAGSKILFGDPFSASPVPELHLNPRSHFKPCEPVASSPSGSLISGNFELHDSPITPKIGFGPRKPEFHYPHGETPSPDLSAQESVSKDEGRKAESKPCRKSKLEEELCILNNLYTENQRWNKNSECEEVKDASSGLTASVKPTLLERAEKPSSSMNSPEKYRSIIENTEDYCGYEIPIPFPNRNGEMEEAEPQETKKESKQHSDFVDSSCRVMMLRSISLCAEGTEGGSCTQQHKEDITRLRHGSHG